MRLEHSMATGAICGATRSRSYRSVGSHCVGRRHPVHFHTVCLVFAMALSAAFRQTCESRVSASCHRLKTMKFLSHDVTDGGRNCWPKPDSILERRRRTEGAVKTTAR